MADISHWVALRLGNAIVVRDGTLPSITGDWPELSAITAAVQAPSAVPIAPARHGAQGQVHVLRLPDGVPAPDGVEQLSLDRLTSLPVPQEVTDAISSAVSEHDGARSVHPLRPPWYHPGWAEQALAWADETLAGHGRWRTGPPVSLKAWSLSAVLRLPCVDSAGQARDVYLKAPCEWFRDEAALTDAVARFGPAEVPRVIGYDTERGILLMEPLPGADPDLSPTDVAVRTARSMLGLQHRTRGALDDLKAAGAPVRDLHTTLEAFEQILGTHPELDLLTEQERAALPQLVAPIRDQIERLAACEFPTVLSHGDLHLGNVAANADDLVIFDWSDACLTHPLLDIAHLARAAERAGGDAATVLAEARQTWQEVLPSADVDAGIAGAPLANRLFQTVTSAGIIGNTEPAASGELGGSVAFQLRHLLSTVGD